MTHRIKSWTESHFGSIELCVCSDSWFKKLHVDITFITVSCENLIMATRRVCSRSGPRKNPLQSLFFWIFKWRFHDEIWKRESSASCWHQDFPANTKNNVARNAWFFCQNWSKHHGQRSSMCFTTMLHIKIDQFCWRLRKTMYLSTDYPKIKDLNNFPYRTLLPITVNEPRWFNTCQVPYDDTQYILLHE